MSKEVWEKGDAGACGDNCFCDKKPKEEDNTYDNRLQNWETWMKRRRKIHDKLSQPLGRPVGELVMNTGDEYRNIQEDREVFYYTNVTTNFDKLRGNPEFWKLPAGLASKCEDIRDPIYFAVKTKFEKNEIPSIEYVRNPNYILNEKNVLSHTRKLYNLWKKSKYRNDQMKRLSSKVNLIEPHKPECEELIIVGKKLGSPPKLEEQQHVIREETSSMDWTIHASQSTPRSHVFEVNEIPKSCFTINGIMLSRDDALVNNTVKIRLLFECAENLTVPVVRHLRFQNKGLSTIRFYWNRIEKFRIFRNLTQSDREECQEFYFDKNELLLVPGSTIEFPVWFNGTKVGNYVQFWKITTLPKFWDDDFQLILLLQGIIHVVGFEEKSKNIKQMLQVRARNTLIKNLLRSMLDNFKYRDTETTTWVFSEEQIFESVNQDVWWGADKRPKYLYDKNIINELKEFYKEVKQTNFPSNWNYSISELKIMTRKKDISDYVENMTNEAVKARRRRVELRMEPKLSDQLPSVKKTVVPSIKLSLPLGDPDKEENDQFAIKETRYNRLEEILHKLERPLMIQNEDREKYFTVYIVMCSYLSKMCDALEAYDNYKNCLTMNEDYCPICEQSEDVPCGELPDRLIFERFEDIWLDGTKLIQPDSKIVDPVFPKPEILKNIPQEDTRVIYHTYFGIPMVDPIKKGGKDKKDNTAVVEKEVKDKKAKEEDKNRKIDVKTSEYAPVKTIKEPFDPYAEDYIPRKYGSSSKFKSSHQNVKKDEYNYDRYLIVYTYLSEAIGAMVDTLETFKEITVASQTLGEMKKCARIYPEEEISSGILAEESEEFSGIEISSYKSEEDIYFQYLLDTHLNKNISTKRYIVFGQTQDKYETDDDSSRSKLTIRSGYSRANLFRSHETVIESTYTDESVSIGVQTSGIDEDYRQISKESLDKSTTPESVHTVNTVGESLSHIFYFMDDSDEEAVENVEGDVEGDV